MTGTQMGCIIGIQAGWYRYNLALQTSTGRYEGGRAVCPGGFPASEKGEMMRSVSGFVHKLALAGCLLILSFAIVGCGSWAQLGETEAEGARRHKRVSRINRAELNSDIDRVFLLDQPSKLTDKRIP